MAVLFTGIIHGNRILLLQMHQSSAAFRAAVQKEPGAAGLRESAQTKENGPACASGAENRVKPNR